MSTLSFDNLDRFVLLVHTEREPSDEDWDRYAELLRKLGEVHSKLGLIVVSDAAGPNANQRKRVSELGVDVRTAVVTQSRVARGIVTALGWVGAEIRAFPPTGLEGAYDFVGLEAQHRADVSRRLATMRVELAGGDSGAVATMSPSAIQAILEKGFSEL